MSAAVKIITLFLLFLGSPMTHAQDAHAQPKQGKCTSTPCGNTASGEDPQEQRIREGAARSAAIRAGGDDQVNWGRYLTRLTISLSAPAATYRALASGSLSICRDDRCSTYSGAGPNLNRHFRLPVR